MTVSVGVIGCGYWGKNLVRVFSELGALKIVYDPEEKARTRAAEIAPNIKIVSNLDDILHSDIKGLVISSPAETHYSLTKSALEAGKDVLCEKPLALTYEQGADLVQTAEKNNRILMVGHVLEYHPAIRKLLDLIHSGELGKIRYIYSNRVSLGKIRREENILWSFAPHDIAVTLRILGQMPFQVRACGGSYLQANIPDVTVTHLLFDNGVRAHIFVSWLHPFKEQRLVVIGSHKMASFDDVAKKLILYDQHVDFHNGQPLPIKGEGVEVPFPSDEPLKLECKAFLSSIHSRHPSLTDGKSGLRVLKVLQAAQRSLVMNGEPVNLPMETFNE